MPAYRSWLSGIRAKAALTALAAGAAAFAVSPASAATSPAAAQPPAKPTAGWRTVPAPAVAAGASANLTALAMASPTLGWTAGFTLADNQNAPFEPLLAAWNGRRWRTIPVDLGPAPSGRLDGLAEQSPDDAWAVGTAYGADSSLPLFLHWNGRRWARVAGAAVPGFSYVSLLGVAVRSASDAWAVGEAQSAVTFAVRPVIEHWNGRRWQLMANPPVPSMSTLSGVSVAADGEAWAVGSPLDNDGHGLILHWTGRAWTTATTPVTGGSVLLSGVTAVGQDNVWAVGTDSAAGGPYLPYALRWNGRGWVSVSVAHPGEGSQDWGFEAVTSTGHGDLTAVGSAGSATVGRALYGRWDGRSWSLTTGPDITQLSAVSPDGSGALWAVGSQSASDQVIRPVVQVSG